MKVIHIIAGLGQGGAEAMLAKLVRTSCRFQHVVLSIAGDGPLAAAIRDAGVPIIVRNLHGVSELGASAFSLPRLIGRERPDIIQGWMTHGNLASLYVRAFHKNIPVIWSVRQALGDTRNIKKMTRGLIKISAKVSRCPDEIIYNSNRGASDHESAGFCSLRRRVIPNGFDTGVFYPSRDDREHVRKRLGISSRDIVIGLMARWHPIKNHSSFMRAAQLVLERYPNARFLLAGTGISLDNAALSALMTDEVRKRSLLLGDRRDMPELTRALDIACNVSHSEGFPNVIGEAMASAVPCVVSARGDMPEIIDHTGAVCRDVGGEAIAAAICQLIAAGPQKMVEMGALARERVVHRYSIEAVISQYEAAYFEVAARRRERASRR